jgi:DNA-binding GntR family transcriptional regulator
MEIVVQTLAEQIYALLRDRIISGGLEPSAALRQDALAAELGVSKIPLREAFTRLEQDGLLQYAANRGFVVRALSTDEAEEVYALRLKIEPEAVGMAARKANDQDKKVARAALAALDEAAAGPDKSKVGKLNREFHMALVRPLGRQITVQVVERLNLISERYVGKHLEPMGREGRAQKEHETMFEAWRQGQSKVVEGLMYDHIAFTLEDLRKQFEIDKAAAAG